VLVYFALTLFTSATLLFLVQPMIGRLILPSLGGTPAVWNTCMVFFQAVLLVGYFYTHTVTTYLTRRQQLLLQAVLLTLPIGVLPFSLGNWQPPTDVNPAFSVLGILTLVVGLPFFVVSTSAPLLQKWFAHTDHPAAEDPYFLYGASNLGSMLALVLYPALVESFFDIDEQGQLWRFGYFVFAALVFGCIVVLWRGSERGAVPKPALAMAGAEAIVGAPPASLSEAVKAARPRPVTPAATVERVTWRRRLRWLGLSFFPSSLCLGVTYYLTTDIAAVPFFWVLPLALYLLTFILVFSRWPTLWTEGPHNFVLYAQPCFLLFLMLKLIANLSPPTWLLFLLHLFAFFFCALMCHGELAKDRPSTKHITEFYLWMSVGGVLGGLFNALIAPMVFWFGVIEYPLALILCNFLRPNMVTEETLIPSDSTRDRTTPLGIILDLLIPLGIGLLTYCILEYVPENWQYSDEQAFGLRRIIMPVPVILTLSLAMRPVRFSLALFVMWLTVFLYESLGVDTSRYKILYQDRSFFGPVTVREETIYHDAGQHRQVVGEYHLLVHGGIDHGRQSAFHAKRRQPLAYFHPLTGIGQVFQKFSGLEPLSIRYVPADFRVPAAIVGLGGDPFAQVMSTHAQPPYAVVGLGVGSLATHARPFQSLDYYEIDPLVLKLSTYPEKRPFFTYLRDARERNVQLSRGVEPQRKDDVMAILGDGRLKIKEAPEHWYHIICLDAFSSDAIPVHLLTADAVDLYLEKLVPGGLLVFNATNNFVDIKGVLREIADARGLECYHLGDSHTEMIPEKWGTDYVILRRNQQSIDALLAAKKIPFSGMTPLAQYLDVEGWETMRKDYQMEPWIVPEPAGRLWTDRFSNLLGVLRLK
jgi:hypothetical protein